MMSLMSDGMSSVAWSTDSAMSGEAMYLRTAVYEANDIAEQSQALFGEKAEAIQAIWRLQTECAVDDWDGYESMRIPLESAQRAAGIIRALPRRTPMPEFSAEPDGSVALDWISSRSKLFSISIGRSDRLSFAWLDGADRGHGVAVFDGTTIPPKILEGIQEFAGGEKTRIRIA